MNRSTSRLPHQSVISLWWLALATALLPLVAIHITFVVSALEGHIDWCVPYWDSCTSISRTGRYGTAYFIFKGTMLPAALLGLLFWWLNARWLSQLQARKCAWLPWLGLIASLSLTAYTLALGHAGEGFGLARRTGVVLYFSLTFIAQLLLSARLLAVPQWARHGRRLLRLCQLTLAIGLVSVILTAVVPDVYSRMDDAFEWVLALLINVHALGVAWLWRRTDFRARLWAG